MIHIQSMKEKLVKYKNYPGYAFVVITLALVLLFVVFTFQWYFHSDAATKMLLASEIIKNGTIIPPDWYYVNGDIWIFFIHLPLVILERIFGYGWAGYVTNSIVYICIYLAAFIYFAKQLKVGFSSKILLFVMAFSAYSTVNAMMVFGELTGISEPIFIFTLLGIFLSLEKSQDKKYFWMMGILIFVYTVAGPSRSLINNASPAILVTFLLYIDSKSKKYLLLMGTILLSFSIASAVYFLLLAPNVLMEFSRNNLSFASYSEVFMNIDIFTKGLFSYFSLEGPRSLKVESFNGGLYFLNFLFLLFAITAIVKMTQVKTKEISLVNIVSFLFLYYFITIGYLYIFTNPLAKDSTTFRYFRPLFYLAMIFMVLYIDKFNKAFRDTLIVILLLYLTTINYKVYTSNASPGQLWRAHNKSQGVANYLMDQNLTHGYASYWHAGVTMTLTGNKTVVAPIHLHNFTPRRWLSSESWFHNTQAKRTFLLLTQGEYGNVKANIKKYIPKDPIDKVIVGNYVILIYESNGPGAKDAKGLIK
ncbi:MAG: hypothetical protein U9R26_03315 [Campylobacterota bacterium]|nr:hypothetical protein [Campylobacterota bacterium]